MARKTGAPDPDDLRLEAAETMTREMRNCAEVLLRHGSKAKIDIRLGKRTTKTCSIPLYTGRNRLHGPIGEYVEPIMDGDREVGIVARFNAVEVLTADAWNAASLGLTRLGAPRLAVNILLEAVDKNLMKSAK